MQLAEKLNITDRAISKMRKEIEKYILDKDKLFYYRGLKEHQSNKEKGYLIDTCLNAQNQYKKLIEYYLKW